MQKLLKKEYSPENCEETVNCMVELGYINDEDYAERYIKDAVEFKKHGIMRIKQDLRKKGIDRDIIDNVIGNIDIDNGETLQKLIEQRCKLLNISDPKQKNRLIGFLVRRGYRYDEIYSVLREMEEIDFD